MAEGRLEGMGRETLTVWLDVNAEHSVRRVGRSGRVRPLLQVSDPLERAARLLAERARYYERAELRLDTTTSTPAQLVDRILEHLRVSRREGGR